MIIRYNNKIKNPKDTEEKLMVSVCVMSYNLEKHIAEALDSILMQKVNFRYNIVVGEDCSTDNTRKILQDYVNKYPDKFTLLLHKENLGVVANFAATLKACEGKYIALLDGDDYWTDPLKLQKQVDFLEHNKDYSMTFHNIEFRNETKNGVTVKPFNQEGNSREYTYDEILKTWSVTTCAVLCINNEQYKYIEKNLWFPVQDLPFYLSCASKGKIYYMSDTMSIYRRLLSGSMNTEKFKSIENNLTFIKYFKTLHNDFSNLLSKESIDHISALNYFWAARKSKNIGDEENYSQYMIHAMSLDPEIIFKHVIQPKDKKIQDLKKSEKQQQVLMDLIREVSKLRLVRHPIKKYKAYKSMLKTYFNLKANT